MALESLDRFASDTMGKSYGNFNGGFVGECVSYVQQYMIRCLGISPSGWGNAVDYWTKPNPNFAKHFTRIGADQPRKDGDIIVWQGDARSGVSHYGHIAIAYQGRVLQQNFEGRYVSLNNMFTPGLLGYWRPNGAVTQPNNPQGGGMITNRDQLSALYNAVLRRPRGNGEGEDVYLGKDSGFVFNNLYNSNERATRLRQEADEKNSLVSQRDQANAKSVGLVASVSDLTARLKNANDQLAVFQAEAAEPDLVAKAQAEIDRLEAELTAAEKKIKLLEADKLKPTQPVDPVVPNNQTPETSTQTPTLSEVLSVIKRWLVSFIKRN